ncbi:NADPH-dependent FMN reductase [Fulvivirga ligni]|uniref:NADPH-dependent FMN reductase n=1 Tax=Fulvivirga ligni TaxID=2904246 RepID=UPI001F1737A0|nr:NAD(P)H-dependent oxidoreductase [Fulvivirga ligni]UII24241.1 NAD(P)H-dependent oxidoreductase [Fulvivirga ligni]
MSKKLKIIGICGSASQNSGNLAILKFISECMKAEFDIQLIDDLAQFPHFRTELTTENTPEKISEFRNAVQEADGIIICSPEYVFSIPSGLKNVLEWCVSTTVFSDKPVALITASASGEKGHEELQLIMKTIQASFTEDSTLLIQGIKGKISKEGEILDQHTKIQLQDLVKSFNNLLR